MEVLLDKCHYHAFDAIEIVREEFIRSREIIHRTDYGAGSRTGSGGSTTLSRLARRVACSPRTGKFLFRLAHTYKPAFILEMGTSLGISTRYLAAGAPHAKVITLEGDPELCRRARSHLPRQVKVLEGPFDQTLPHALAEMASVDLVYLDGDHRGDRTLDYWKQLLPHLHGGSIVILGDIHWSDDMERAWEAIRAQPSVRMSIDLFGLGILFFSEDILHPEHLGLRVYR